MDSFCSTAPVDDEFLKRVCDGERLSASTRMHLAECDSCQQRFLSYIRLHTALLSRLYRSQCPGMMTLSAYCLKALPLDEWYRISYHVHICPLCAREVQVTLQELLPLDFFASERDCLVSGEACPRIEEDEVASEHVPR